MSKQVKTFDDVMDVLSSIEDKVISAVTTLESIDFETDPRDEIVLLVESVILKLNNTLT